MTNEIRTLRRLCISFYMIIAVVCFAGGQYFGYNMTEGEKLVKLWPLWASGFSGVIAAVITLRIK